MSSEQKPTISLTEGGNLQIRVPLSFKNKRGRKLILMPEVLGGGNSDAHGAQQEAVVTALARAFAWSELLESGEVASISDLARRLGVDSSYVGRILRLTTLAPDIAEALLQGREPGGLSLARLTKTLPPDWAEQRAGLGFQQSCILH